MSQAPWMYQQSYGAPQQGSSHRGSQSHRHHRHGFPPQNPGRSQVSISGEIEGGTTEPSPASPLHYQSLVPNAHDYADQTIREHEQAHIPHDRSYETNDGAPLFAQHRQPPPCPPQQHDPGANLYYTPDQHRPTVFDYSSTKRQMQHHQQLYEQKGPSPPTSFPPGSQHSAIGSTIPPLHHMNPSISQMDSQGTMRQSLDHQWAHPLQYQSMSYPSNAPFMHQFHQGYLTHATTHHNPSAGLPLSQSQYPSHYYHQSSATGYPVGPHPYAAMPSSEELTASQSGAVKEQPKKKPKQRKVQRKVGKPKRPLSAYNLFFKDGRAKMLAESGVEEDDESDAGSDDKKKAAGQGNDKKKKKSGIGFAEMAQVISGQWKKIDKETLAAYKEKAALDMRRYREEMDEFNMKQQQQQQQQDLPES